MQLTPRTDYDATIGQLIDARAVRGLGVSGHAIRTLARSSPNAPGAKRPIVVSSVAAFGLARMFQILREDSPEEVRLFLEVTEARSWLGLD